MSEIEYDPIMAKCVSCGKTYKEYYMRGIHLGVIKKHHCMECIARIGKDNREGIVTLKHPTLIKLFGLSLIWFIISAILIVVISFLFFLDKIDVSAPMFAIISFFLLISQPLFTLLLDQIQFDRDH